MHLPSSNVLREWKRDIKSLILSYPVSRALLFLSYGGFIKTLQSEAYYQIKSPNADQCTEHWLRVRKPAFWVGHGHTTHLWRSLIGHSCSQI